MNRIILLASGLTAVALLCLAPAADPAAADEILPFGKMTVDGTVASRVPGGGASTLTFDVDFELHPRSDGLALGGGRAGGDRFLIETSIATSPGIFQDSVTDNPGKTLLLSIAVKGECFEGKNRRFELSLSTEGELAECVETTLRLPGLNPLPLALLQSMDIKLWPLGRPDRWRMRSMARFASPPFGYPVAGFGPGSWTALVIGDDGGRAATSAVRFEGGL